MLPVAESTALPAGLPDDQFSVQDEPDPGPVRRLLHAVNQEAHGLLAHAKLGWAMW